METINNITINTEDINLMRSLAIGGYIEGWAHAFAFCNNCDNYHTVSQGRTCHNGQNISHRSNAQTNYLYIPDPVVGQAANSASLLQPAPQIGAGQDAPVEEHQEDIIPPTDLLNLFNLLLPADSIYQIYEDDNETITDDEDNQMH